MLLIDQVRMAMRFSPGMARAVRRAASVTQSAMGAELGVDQSTVARWESGERRPTGERLRRYRDLLDELSRELDQEGGSPNALEPDVDPVGQFYTDVEVLE